MINGWDVFQDIGRTMRAGVAEFLGRGGGLVPLGTGAGGDKTFPVDKWAEDIVIDALERVHRDGESFTLISEEAGIRRFGDGKLTILVDPIDGSNNAKTGVPFFSTAIALLNGDKLSDLAVGYVINLAMGTNSGRCGGRAHTVMDPASIRLRRTVSRSWHSKHRIPPGTFRSSCRCYR